MFDLLSAMLTSYLQCLTSYLQATTQRLKSSWEGVARYDLWCNNKALENKIFNVYAVACNVFVWWQLKYFMFMLRQIIPS